MPTNKDDLKAEDLPTRLTEDDVSAYIDKPGEKGEDESDPQKSGGACDPDSGTESHTAIRPHAGRSRPYLSLREGSDRRR